MVETVEMSSELEPHQKAFIDLAIEYDVLRFGEFELKSGRISPYFFNAGNFNSGRALATLGKCYASAIAQSGLEIDLLFGPAYKGIPLVAVTAAALSSEHNLDLPFCFNRKEAKTHGEGGIMVGAELRGRTLVLDDVITAGTAIREVVNLLNESAAELSAVLIGLDRQERAPDSEQSAVQAIEAELNIPVLSIVTLDHVRNYLQQKATDNELLTRIDAYRETYGV